MNKILSLNILNQVTKFTASASLDQLYQKVSYAGLFRYRDRMYMKPIAYPPTIYGDEEYEVSAKKLGNRNIRRILRIRRHPERSIFPGEYSLDGPPRGRVYEKFPFKYTIEKDKTYFYCTCGFSNSQPFCDGTHKMLWTTHLKKNYPKYRPIKFVADETKDVWFCNCKQSKSRPFCDGTHKLDQVKSGNSVK